MTRFGPVVPELNIRKRSEEIGEMPVANQSAAWASVAQTFRRSSTRLADMAAAAASREGEAAGLAAGARPGFELMEGGSIRAEAFNRAGLRSAATRTETALIEGLDKLWKENPDNGAAFQEGVKALQQRYIDPLPAEIRADVAQGFARQRLGYERDYARLEAERLSEQARAEALPAIDQRLKMAGRVAYSSGLDETSDVAIEGELSALAQLLITYGPATEFQLGGRTIEADPDRPGIFGVDDIQARLLEATESIQVNRVKGTFDRLKTPEERAAFAKSFRADYETSGSGEVTGGMDLQSVEQMDRYFQQAINEDERARADAIREANAARREATASLRSEISDFKHFARNGLVPDPEKMASMRAQAISLGDADLVTEIDRINVTSSIVSESARFSPAELRREISQRRQNMGEGASPDEAEALLALETGLSRVTRGLAEDPVGFAITAGVVEDLPLTMTEEGAELAMRARVGRASLIEGRYGVPAGLFNADEISQLSRVAREDPAATAGLAEAIVKGAGADAFRYLGDLTDDVPMLAQMGAVLASGGSRDAVRAAADGMRLQAESSGVSTGLSATTSGGIARDELKALDALPDDRARIEAFANNIYLGRMGMNRDFDADQYRRALEEAAGARYRGGVKFGGTARVNPNGWNNAAEILVPSWMRADEADTVLSALTLEDYEAAGGIPRDIYGEPIAQKELRQARLETVGNGVYELVVATRDGEAQYAAGDGPGGRYRLDINKIEDRIAARYPEAVSR